MKGLGMKDIKTAIGNFPAGRITVALSCLFAVVLSSAGAFAGNAKDYEGLYRRAGGGTGDRLGVEGVLFNDADVLNVILDGREYRPVRQTESLASFVHRDGDCTIAFTPYAAEAGKQGMYVETVPGATCKGEDGKDLPDYRHNYVREEKPEPVERYDLP